MSFQPPTAMDSVTEQFGVGGPHNVPFGACTQKQNKTAAGKRGLVADLWTNLSKQTAAENIVYVPLISTWWNLHSSELLPLPIIRAWLLTPVSRPYATTFN